jgi:hypothetical protein
MDQAARRRHRRIVPSLAVVALLAAGLVSISPVSISDVEAATKDPCLIPGNDCVTVTYEPGGVGSGTLRTTTSTWVPDGVVDCRRSGGVTSGQCVARYLKSADGVIIRFRLDPDEGSLACERNSCQSPSESKLITFSLSADISEYPYTRGHFRLQDRAVVVSLAGVQTDGRITSSPSGIDCAPTAVAPSTMCSATFPYGTQLTLSAQPGPGSTLSSWNGSCAGQGMTCGLALTSDVTTQAVFAAATPPPTPTKAPAAAATQPPSTAADVAAPTADPVASAPEYVVVTEGPTSPTAPADAAASAATDGAAGVAASAPPQEPAELAADAEDGSVVLPLILVGLVLAAVVAALGLRAAGFELRRRGS